MDDIGYWHDFEGDILLGKWGSCRETKFRESNYSGRNGI